MKVKQWNWMMDYCKNNELSPSHSFAWDKAKTAYETCKTCGYRNKLNSHCTLNQLSVYVDDDHSCEKWER